MSQTLASWLAASVAALVVGTVGPAGAADLLPPVAATEEPDWTGLWVGGAVGYALGHFDTDPPAPFLGLSGVDDDLDDGNFAFGVRGGADLEVHDFDGANEGALDALVIGVLGEFMFTDLGDTSVSTANFDVANAGPPGVFNIVPFGTSDDCADGTDCSVAETFSSGADTDWYASVRARAGLGGERLFLYGTGGLALTNYEAASSTVTVYREDAAETVLNNGVEIPPGSALPAGCFFSPSPDEPTERPVTCTSRASAEETVLGFAIGVGAQLKLRENLTVGAEYLHMEFEEIGEGGFDADSSLDTFTLNVNLRF